MADADNEEIRRLQAERAAARRSITTHSGPSRARNSKYVAELPSSGPAQSTAAQGGGRDEEQHDEQVSGASNPLDRFTAPQHLLHEFAHDGDDDDEASDPLLARAKQRTIAARQNDYHLRRFNRSLDDEADVGTNGSGDDAANAYQHAMRRAEVEREEERVRKILEQRQREAATGSSGENGADGDKTPPMRPSAGADGEPDDLTPKMGKKRRWDTEDGANGGARDVTKSPLAETHLNGASPRPSQDGTQQQPPRKRRSRWDETPAAAVNGAAIAGTDVSAVVPSETPKRSSRWDQTPVASAASGFSAVTGTNGSSALIPGQIGGLVSRYMSDEELDAILPAEGYKIVEPPPDYAPIRTPARKLLETPIPLEGGSGFMMQDEAATRAQLEAAIPNLPTDIPGVGQLAYFKAEDQQYFEKILKSDDQLDSELSVDELKERKIMRLLLKIKNGTPPMRKTALRQITDKAREFGAGPLFDKILPLLMERSLEDQERHLLVKVIDRILYKLDDLVRPYVHRILVVIEPLLIDEDYYARVEGREIISNLSKAAGLAHMISTMRPDIDHVDEYVRNTTARAFAVVASALGIPALLPFLRVVCRSKKSWQARHTGMRIIQQIAIMLGCAVLPHLKALVDCVEKGLEDDQQKVKTMTALALAALAEAAAPYGIESFENVLKPLWMGIRQHRGKGLAAFLKAIGFIIPLMDSESTVFFVKEVTPTLIREFQSADEEMKKIVLKVVKQCAATDGVTGQFLKEEMLPEFFKHFWLRRMSLDKRNYRQVVETTVELAQKTGVHEIVARIVNDLKDESEPYRKMVMETISKVVGGLGSADIDERLEIQLIDGLIYAFQEQTVEDAVILDGFGTIVNALGMRCKPYLAQIVSTILWRLGNKNAKTRQQAADLVTKLAVVIRHCGEDALLAKLGVGLFEQLGEEFPEALASIISALSAVANVVGMSQMNPPIKDLLPRMTPILRNRHEKVQEASINLIGRIADRGAEFVSPREWMRITFELLDLLKAHKRAIRRAAVNSFGYIAKAIGPQDVLQVLLTNLRVQERQSRVCSTVAIAIVAETCSPFTTIPHILQEYRTPELNVRNGCLKALSFLFEYIGEMGKDYVNSVVTLLEDALTDRDHVHRQTAAAIVKHIALGVVGLGQEDALLHLLNLVWPNIFETSPHLIGGIMDAIEALRPALGPGIILNYTLPGLFHPARRVREVYARIYNTTYLQAQDGLVPYYPDLGELDVNYRRHDLYAFL